MAQEDLKLDITKVYVSPSKESVSIYIDGKWEIFHKQISYCNCKEDTCKNIMTITKCLTCQKIIND